MSRLKPLSVITLLLLAAAPAARAGIRPSFSLEYCSWNATHVLVATEGEKIDGDLTVLESWKGDLAPGEAVHVPGLAAFREKSSRLVNKPFGDGTAAPPLYVTGDRMVLFLRQRPKAGAAGVRAWEPASRDGINVSVLWVEGGKAYAFVQVINPGDSILIDYGPEGKIRDAFSEIDAEHASLERAAAVKNASARAEALEPFTAHELFLAREAAFEALRRCGRAALPVLLRVLHDQTRLKTHGEVIEALAEIGGQEVGEELTAVVGEELDFWKATAPGLRPGWWNEMNRPETETLRERYSKLYQALNGLQKLRYAGSREVVTELRDFWRSLPQLDDRSGLNQMSEACDAVIGKLK